MPTTEEGSQEVQEESHDSYMSESDESSFEEEDSNEQANLCLIAHENEINTEIPIDFIFEKLHETFYDLIDELKKLGIKNKKLKSKNQYFTKRK